MSDDDNGRVSLSLPLGDDLSCGTSVHSGPVMHHLTIRGNREQAEELVLHLLAELSGDEDLFDKLQFEEIRRGLRTLGEIGTHGLDADLEDELSETQVEVMNTLAKIYQAGMANMMGGTE